MVQLELNAMPLLRRQARLWFSGYDRLGAGASEQPGGGTQKKKAIL
jgi:hypothetical protein